VDQYKCVAFSEKKRKGCFGSVIKEYPRGSLQPPNGGFDKMNVKKKHLAGIQKPSLLVLGENTPFISFHSTNISFHAPNHLFARSVYRSHF